MDNSSLDEIFSTNSESGSHNEMTPNLEPQKPSKPKIFGGSKTIIAIGVIIAIIGIFVIGFFVGNATHGGVSKNSKIIDEVYNIANKYYYEDITNDDIERLMAAGMVGVLDDYTDLYLNSRVSKGTYGFDVRSDDYNNHLILEIDDGSSLKDRAYRGDKLVGVRINDRGEFINVDHMERKKLLKLLSNSSTMDIKVERNGEIVTIEGLYKQDIITNSLAEYRDTGVKGIGYIWLKSFRENAKEAFMAAKYSFEQSGNNILILDLRDNPGGIVEQLDYISRCFIPNPTDKDVVNKVIMKNKSESIGYARKYDYSRMNGMIYTNNDYFGKTITAKTGKPFRLVVVANNMSASAAETLIGNILHYMHPSDYLLLGEDDHTYGKGVAQTDVTLKSDPSLYVHITVGKFYVLGKYGTPEENDYTNIHGIGYELDDTDIVKELHASRLDDSAIKVAIARAQALWQ